MAVYLFSGFKLDTIKSELSLDAETISVEPQTILVLELLVQKAGRVVTKEELIETVWDGRIISRAVLDNRIRLVRQVLGDTGKDQKFIKTYPNKGYKFVASVKNLSDGQRLDSLERGSRVFYAGAAVVLTSLIVATVWQVQSNGSGEPQRPQISDQISEQTFVANLASVEILPIEFPERLAGQVPPQMESVPSRTATILSAFPGFAIHVGADDPDNSSRSSRDGHVLKLVVEDEASTLRIRSLLEDKASGNVLWSKQYELAEQGAAAANFEDMIAQNIALSAANALGVSTSSINTQVAGFDLVERFQSSIDLMRGLDPDGITEARLTLEAIIEEEPDFLPAYAGLYHLAYLELAFTDSDLDEMLDRMDETAEKMRGVSRNAPETLVVESMQIDYDLTSLEQTSDSSVDYLLRAVASAPNNFIAHEALGNLYHNVDETDKAIDHYDEALKLLPNDPIILADKSGAQMCEGQVLQALATARLNMRRNPSHVIARIQALDFSIQTGDYHTVREELVDLVSDENAGFQEKTLAMDWALMVGDYETALRYAVDAPEAAYVFALLGDNDAAIEAASIMASSFASGRAMHLLGDDALLLALTESEFEQNFGIHVPGHDLSPCHSYSAVYLAEFAETHHPETVAQIRANLVRYFDGTDPAAFTHTEQYSTLAAFHAWNGDADKTVQILAQANDAGLVFLHRLEDPLFRQVQENEAFRSEVARMKARADELREQIVL